MKRLIKILAFTAGALIVQCREPFEPTFETGLNDYLVVEGFINVGTKAVTEIKLSRVSRLDDTTPPVEQRAMVEIESHSGERYALTEKEGGRYLSDSLTLDAAKQYRLLIREQSGREYASTLSAVTPAPPIDSIYWTRDHLGFHIIVRAHGGPEDTKFYSWSYVETWEIRSPYKSQFRYINGEVKRRPNVEMSAMRLCWNWAYQKDLNFASTEQYSENKIDHPVVTFAHYSDRVHARYSILVVQRAMTEDEYRYQQLIQKNSTSTGSLFDPMPTEIHGNVVSVGDPSATVIGYVGAYATKMRRKFITAAEFGEPPPAKCELTIVETPDIPAIFGIQGFQPVDSLGLDEHGLPIYNGAPVSCVDCRTKGSPVKPDFWN